MCIRDSLQVAGHVRELWERLEAADEVRGVTRELARVGILQAVLVFRAAHDVLDRDVLHWLHVQADALHLGERLLQPADEVRRRLLSHVERLQVDLDPPAVEGLSLIHI